MHGERVKYGSGAQFSHDAWHPLNLEGQLEFIGEGETFFRVSQPDGKTNVASLVFNRPVPPAQGGRPGRLVLKFRHQAGVMPEASGASVVVRRKLQWPLLDLRAMTNGTVELNAVREPGHVGLFARPSADSDGATRYAPALKGLLVDAQEEFLLSARLSADVRERFAELAAGMNDEQPPTESVREAATGRAATGRPGANMPAVYGALAGAFGLGFVVSVIVMLRGRREDQRARLDRAPGGRDELLRELALLDADFEKGALPATSYQAQRARLMTRLVEMTAGRGGA
jgi:hypothetical protein